MGSSSLRKHAKFLENHVFSRNLNPFSLRSHVLGQHFIRKLGPIFIREIASPLLPQRRKRKVEEKNQALNPWAEGAF
jgi:hypothetical protein